jgi:hypothetical protein
MAMAMATVVLEMGKPMEKGREVAEERQTMLLLWPIRPLYRVASVRSTESPASSPRPAWKASSLCE